ncbi:unnamed protein product [Parnassius apollo]|uniref:(apollo) hypothetical protein n=1 Tax=Parnassius apollo TaxID=110799 RepID=A0A8S3Y4Q3_PARAO|nr:unnamed protein product [Parnassius apollo]
MPRKYTRTTTRATSYKQEVLEIAIQRIKNKELSYAAASRIDSIPTSTLSDRVLKKTATKSKTLGRSTAIPIELEIKLANCLRVMEKWGWGLSRKEEVEKAAHTCNTCDETIEAKDIWKDKDSDDINTLEKTTQKVTMLSSVKLTPENQAFYKTYGSSQPKPINIDRDIFIDLKEKNYKIQT